jgi:hypothetical protein
VALKTCHNINSPGDSPELPYIHKQAVELLKADYSNRETAGRQIVGGIENYYRTPYPEVYNGKRVLVEQSADNVAKIYLRNIFPDMNMTWGVHPNNLGHKILLAASAATTSRTLARTARRFPTYVPPAITC